MHKITWLICIILLIIAGCNKEKNGPGAEDCNNNCIQLSQLQTKSNHHVPLRLYHDISGSIVTRVMLNDEELDWSFGDTYELNEAGFYELRLQDHSGVYKNVLFSLVEPEREHAEWGIGKWVPAMFETTEHQGEEIQVIHPGKHIEGIEVPFIFYIRENNRRKPVYFDADQASSGSEFYIKRGVGSVQLNSEDIQNEQVQFSIGGTNVNADLTKVSEADQVLEGDINTDETISANSIVHVSGDLRILSGNSFTVEEGVVMLIDEAVNIENNGQIYFNGTQNNPILVTSSDAGKYWGGIITDGSGTSVEAKHSIFSRSGYHDSDDYNWGHAKRQALFYHNNSSLTMTNCYMIDHIGQIFYPRSSSLDLNHILVQRVKTGGQLNYSGATIRNAVFTDFPDDSQTYIDKDNDGLYIHASDVTIDSSVFMFAKDDGLDSGGGEGGEVTITNTRFEACFHEGAALSSGGDVNKTHTFKNCVFVNCGQGLELGFSSPNHEVFAEDCLFQHNYHGIRYGDNYEWSGVEGEVNVSNSQSIDNEKDVWNMVRSQWEPKLDKMHFENVQVSKSSKQYPELEVIE